MPRTDYESVINVHICSVVPGCAGGYVPGRSVSYENQAKVKNCSAGIVLFQGDIKECRTAILV